MRNSGHFVANISNIKAILEFHYKYFEYFCNSGCITIISNGKSIFNDYLYVIGSISKQNNIGPILSLIVITIGLLLLPYF